MYDIDYQLIFQGKDYLSTEDANALRNNAKDFFQSDNIPNEWKYENSTSVISITNKSNSNFKADIAFISVKYGDLTLKIARKNPNLENNENDFIWEKLSKQNYSFKSCKNKAKENNKSNQYSNDIRDKYKKLRETEEDKSKDDRIPSRSLYIQSLNYACQNL